MYNKDELFGQYIKAYFEERFDQKFYITAQGFICYRKNGSELVIDELYIQPAFRTGWNVKYFVDSLITYYGTGCTTLIGFVLVEGLGKRVEKLFQFYGMKRDLAHDQPDYFKYIKDIR